MKYDRHDRRAIQQLAGTPRMVFEVIEREEKSELVNVPALCLALNQGPKFVLFSCLSGEGEGENLGADLGTLFTTRLRRNAIGFFNSIRDVGCDGPPLVIIDDTEPRDVWGWQMFQDDISSWYQMVIQDTKVPNGWDVVLWSELRKQHCVKLFEKKSVAENALDLHKLLGHMKMFPNKKLMKGVSMEEVALRRLDHYSVQGFLLSRLIPNVILVQTETPWGIKDSLYCQGRNFFPIIHPFEDRS